jgi:hypothetical protein
MGLRIWDEHAAISLRLRRQLGTCSEIERIADALPGFSYPVLIDAKGRCLSDDVGGLPDYDELLSILASPKHD